MSRQLLLIPLLAVAIVMATTAVSQAQYDQVYNDPVYDQEQAYDQNQASVYSVPGQVVRVIYDQGSYTADGQLVYFDQVIARYYGSDRQLREGLADAPSVFGGVRPAAGYMVTCEINVETFGLLAVNNWYRPSRPAPYFVYEPSWYYYSHIILWPEYYRRHFGGYYHGPRYYGGHQYHGPRYRSRDGWDRQPRHGTPSPRYRQPRDRGDRQRQYAPQNPAPRRSPGQYQRPGGRGQYGPPSDRRTRTPDNPGIRPRSGSSPGAPQQQPPRQYQSPRQQDPRPSPAQPPAQQHQPPRQYDRRPNPIQPPAQHQSPGQQYRAPEHRQQQPAPAERSRGSEDRSSRSQGDRPRSRR